MQEPSSLTGRKDDELLTRAEAARIIRRSPGTLGNWERAPRSDRLLPSIRPGGRPLYRVGDVRRYLRLLRRAAKRGAP